MQVSEGSDDVPGRSAAVAGDADTERFDTPTVALMGAAHFVHDTYPAFIGVLLPLLIPKLGITLAAAGVLASAVRWTSMVQPLLGYWADRTDTRYWVVVAPTTTAFFISLMGVAPNYLAVLVLLLLTGFSHAAFHPAGGAMATRASGANWGRGMSYFMTGGELGRAVGPLFIATVVGATGLEWSWVAFFPGLAASLLLYRRLSRTEQLALRTPPGNMLQTLRDGLRPVTLLSGAIAFRSLVNVGVVIFYPTFATGTGVNLVFAGLALTVYELAGTGGAFVGGTLSDRWGRRAMMIAGLLLGVPAVIGAVLTGPTLVGLTLLVAGGLGLLSANPIELVVMQELFPANRAAAVGITYFMRTGGAIIATIAIGVLGDVLGLREALLWSSALSLGSLPFLLLLPETRAPATGAATR